jgi:hypothetical protein
VRTAGDTVGDSHPANRSQAGDRNTAADDRDFLAVLGQF